MAKKKRTTETCSNRVTSFQLGGLFHRCQWLVEWILMSADLRRVAQLANHLEQLENLAVIIDPQLSEKSLSSQISHNKSRMLQLIYSADTDDNWRSTSEKSSPSADPTELRDRRRTIFQPAIKESQSLKLTLRNRHGADDLDRLAFDLGVTLERVLYPPLNDSILDYLLDCVFSPYKPDPKKPDLYFNPPEIEERKLQAIISWHKSVEGHETTTLHTVVSVEGLEQHTFELPKTLHTFSPQLSEHVRINALCTKLEIDSVCSSKQLKWDTFEKKERWVNQNSRKIVKELQAKYDSNIYVNKLPQKPSRKKKLRFNRNQWIKDRKNSPVEQIKLELDEIAPNRGWPPLATSSIYRVLSEDEASEMKSTKRK